MQHAATAIKGVKTRLTIPRVTKSNGPVGMFLLLIRAFNSRKKFDLWIKADRDCKRLILPRE